MICSLNIKEPVMKKHLVLLATVVLIHVLSGSCFAQRQVELIPSISVRETYNDNIFLTNTNEQSDFITAAIPSLTLNVLSEHTKLGMRYNPSFVWYDEFSENNTTRHQGTVSWDQQVTQYMSFNLSNTYLRSEEPLEDPEDFDAERRTRDKYWTNRGRASVGFVFGDENRFDVGYGRRDRETTDVTLNDSTVHEPFARMVYWFDVKNGIRLDYTYKDVTYSLDDDFTSHEPGVRYLRRFSPQSIGYLAYYYAIRDFDGNTEDFVVHSGSVGLDHAFSPEYSISARAGYFMRVNDVTENSYGPSYSLFVTKAFARGSVTIGGDGGWEEAYLRRGVTRFRKYYGGTARGTYRILERLSIYAGAFYRRSKDDREVEVTNLRGDVGLRWSFMRWASLSLEYRYADRDDDIERDSYTNNRVMLILNVSKPYKWL
jgi:hypothetical protein